MRATTIIKQFHEFATSADTLDDLARSFEACCRELKFQSFLYLASDMPFAQSGETYIFSNAKKEWLTYYTETAAHLRDPVVRAAMQTVLPVEWPQEKPRDGLSKDELEFLQDASRYGIRYAAAVPLHGPVPARAVLCFMRDAQKKEKLEHPLFDTLQLLGLKLHSAVRRLRSTAIRDSEAGALTDRELECVAWSARGKTSWETAIILEVTEPTVNFHLTNAMKKLGSVTRPHAVARAVALGLIND